MEGKEIIENMTKSLAVLAPRSSAVKIGSLRVQLKYPSTGGAGSSTVLDMWAKTELADKTLICEAFKVANQTGMTPAPIHSELEKARELLKKYVEQNRISRDSKVIRIDRDVFVETVTFLNECKK